MKFYYRIMNELRDGEHSFKHIFSLTFSFKDEVYVEETRGMEILTYTYAQCLADIEKTSASISELFSDIPFEGTVGLKMKNSKDWIILFWALIRSGFTPVILQPEADRDLIIKIAHETSLKAIITQSPITDCSNCRLVTPDEIYGYTGTPIEPRWANRLIIPTSGTTGVPKLFAYSGEAISAQILNSRKILEQNSDFRKFYHGNIKHLVVLPFSHIFGLTAVFLWFSLFGRTFVLLPDLKPNTVLGTAQYTGVTHIFAVPLFWDTIAEGVLKEAKKSGQMEKLEKGINLSLSLQNIWPSFGKFIASHFLFKDVRSRLLGNGVSIAISGGGSPRSETLRLINAIGYPLHNGYGMTEIGITSVDLHHKPQDRLKLSVGQPLPSVSYELRKDPENGGNVLWVRGKSCFSERWIDGSPQANTPDTWYCTNDFFKMDSEGFYYFVGRNTDLLNGSDGELISLAYLDDKIHSDIISLGCCIGRELESGFTEISYVFESQGVMTNAKTNRLLDEIDAINSNLPFSSKIKNIYWAHSPIPLSYNGKIKRGVLTEGIFSGTFKAELLTRNFENNNSTTKVSEKVLLLCRKAFSEVLSLELENISEDSHFIFDLGGNSMQYLELLSKLDDVFGVSITAEGCKLTTPLEFAEMLEKL